jgi:hypothetical protein
VNVKSAWDFAELFFSMRPFYHRKAPASSIVTVFLSHSLTRLALSFYFRNSLRSFIYLGARVLH